jgi:hypothetical protein
MELENPYRRKMGRMEKVLHIVAETADRESFTLTRLSILKEVDSVELVRNSISKGEAIMFKSA